MASLVWPDRFFSFDVLARKKGFGVLPLPVLCRESPDFGDCWLVLTAFKDTHETSKTWCIYLYVIYAVGSILQARSGSDRLNGQLRRVFLPVAFAMVNWILVNEKGTQEIQWFQLRDGKRNCMLDLDFNLSLEETFEGNITICYSCEENQEVWKRFKENKGRNTEFS